MFEDSFYTTLIKFGLMRLSFFILTVALTVQVFGQEVRNSNTDSRPILNYDVSFRLNPTSGSSIILSDVSTSQPCLKSYASSDMIFSRLNREIKTMFEYVYRPKTWGIETCDPYVLGLYTNQPIMLKNERNESFTY